MKSKLNVFYLSLFCMLFSLHAIAETNLQKSKQNKLLGTWLNQDKTSHIEIFQRENKYFGKIAWLKDPKNENNQDKLDTKNPDNKLKNRKIIGLEILKDFVKKEKGIFEDGEIYNPKDGKTYSCNLTILENGKKLKVRGYVGVSWLGKTQIWTKVK